MVEDNIDIEITIKPKKEINENKLKKVSNELEKHSFEKYASILDRVLMQNNTDMAIVNLSKSRISFSVMSENKCEEEITYIIQLIKMVTDNLRLKEKEYTIEISLEAEYDHDKYDKVEDKMSLLLNLINEDILYEELGHLMPLPIGLDLYVSINQMPVLLNIFNLSQGIRISANVDLISVTEKESIKDIILEIKNCIENDIVPSIKNLSISSKE